MDNPWTAPPTARVVGEPKAGAAHRLPTLSGLSPTRPTGTTTGLIKCVLRCPSDGVAGAGGNPTTHTKRNRGTILEKLFEYSPRLQQAHVFRDPLTAIFDKYITRTQAKHLLKGWATRVKHSEVRCFDGFVKTLMARKDEMTHYFLERHTSGFVEGLNNKIKVIKRRCYGILNAGHLFQRIYLDLFGYRLYA